MPSPHATFTIRPTAQTDIDAIEKLTRDVFWSFWEPGYTVHHNHLAISVLRGAEGYVPELDLVAVDDETDEIVGHVIYTRSMIVPTAGAKGQGDASDHHMPSDVIAAVAAQGPVSDGIEVLTFGPLTVRQDRQGTGIGRALVEHSFAEILRLGMLSGQGRRPAVVTLGVPDYYPHLGFMRGAEFGITFAGHSFDALLAYPLVEGALDGVSGDLVVDPAHAKLTPEAAAEFDKKFPPRAPYLPTPIETLTGAVGQVAVDKLRSAEIDTVDAITGYSQDELAALTHLSPEKLTLVAAAVREATGQRWGRGQHRRAEPRV